MLLSFESCSKGRVLNGRDMQCLLHIPQKMYTPKSQHMYNFKPRTPLYSVDTTKKAKEKNHPKQGVTSQGIRQAAKPYVYVAAICG